MSKLRRLLKSGDDSQDREEIYRLRRLQDVTKAINSELNFRRLLDRIMDVAVDLTGAERGFLILKEGSEHRVAVARNIDREKVQRPEFKISRSIAEKVQTTGVAVKSDNALLDADLSVFSSVMTLKLKSVLCVPLRRKDETIGTLYLDHRYTEAKFTEKDLESLETLADQAAMAIENARLYEDNIRANRELERVNARLQEELNHRSRELSEVRARLDEAVKNPAYRSDFGTIVGDSEPMRRLFSVLDRIVETDLTVLIQGESGTGKELVARFLHFHGKRRDRNFVTVNCGAIPESLLETELFGARKGAYTGADRDRSGLFQEANEGTLFLDEISELPAPLQAKLLRVLQEGEIRPVGSTSTVKVDVRIVSATNQDLAAMVEAGAFRSDLYFRLKGVVVEVPRLRDRREDIPALVERFLGEFSEQRPEGPTRLAPEMLGILLDHPWPGNVRELRNEIQRLSALTRGSVIDDPSLLRNLVEEKAESKRVRPSSARTMEEIERAAIAEALERCDGNKAKAAAELGIPRRTFYDRLRKHGLGTKD